MKTIEIAARLPGGRLLKIFQIKISTVEKSKKTASVRIKITDALGIGYTAGKEYEVDPAEAKKLIEAQKAVPVTEQKIEKATAKHSGKETR